MSNFDKLSMVRVAKYYYLDGLTQEEIAQLENVHRSQISRMLKAAREEGYIDIKIAIPQSISTDHLAEEVGEALSLSQVRIVPQLQTSASAEDSLYFFAARYLEDLLKDCRRIGIGVGKTLYHVAQQLSLQTRDKPIDFYSVAGYSGSDNPYLQGAVILDNFAKAYGGTCHYNNFPIVQNQTYLSDWDKSRLNQLMEDYEKIDTLVISLGGPFSKNYPYLEEFSNAIKDLNMSKALSVPHGNLLGHIFYENHKYLQLPGQYMLTSMPLASIKRLNKVICIAKGSDKVPAIVSAAKQGYIKTLITDVDTAQILLHQN